MKGSLFARRVGRIDIGIEIILKSVCLPMISSLLTSPLLSIPRFLFLRFSPLFSYSSFTSTVIIMPPRLQCAFGTAGKVAQMQIYIDPWYTYLMNSSITLNLSPDSTDNSRYTTGKRNHIRLGTLIAFLILDDRCYRQVSRMFRSKSKCPDIVTIFPSFFILFMKSNYSSFPLYFYFILLIYYRHQLARLDRMHAI